MRATGTAYVVVANFAWRTSDHLERNGPQKIGFADFDAAVAQDGVGRRAMEIDVGQHKVIEVVGALHLAFVGGSKRECDLAFDSSIDLLRINRLDEGNGLRDPPLELL